MLHIASGTAGLILGPLAMRATKRPGPHTRLGEAYHGVRLVVCVSAPVLALLAWHRLWWFLPQTLRAGGLQEGPAETGPSSTGTT